jgi:DNA-binding TFAR19-related protein (PDSD5 family)
MANDSILALIEAEIARLTQVRALLASTGKVSTKLIEKNAKKALVSAKAKTKKDAKTKVKTKAKRVLSPEARARIAEAQRKRWAAQKSK